MALYDDPIEAARRRMFPQQTNRSFFPAVNQRLFDDRSDLLRDTDAAFYGGGNAPPTPTPTPTPRPRGSYFGFPLPIPRPPAGAQAGPPLAPPYLNPPPIGTGTGSAPNFGFGAIGITPNYGFGMNRNNPWEEWQQKYGFGF